MPNHDDLVALGLAVLRLEAAPHGRDGAPVELGAGGGGGEAIGDGVGHRPGATGLAFQRCHRDDRARQLVARAVALDERTAHDPRIVVIDQPGQRILS